MDKREDLPRISVDTIHEWQRIKSGYANEVAARIEGRLAAKDLNSIQGKDWCLRNINQYVDSVFKIARPNLRVNGRNFEDMSENDEEIEPFDEALDRHIWSLSDQRLKWDRVIARARAEKPREVETMLQDLFDRQQEAAAQEIVHVDGDLDHQDVFTLNRRADIEQIFRGASALSEELNQSIPVQFERAKRVKTVMKEVKALRP